MQALISILFSVKFLQHCKQAGGRQGGKLKEAPQKIYNNQTTGHPHSNFKFHPTPCCLPSAEMRDLFLKAGTEGSGHQFLLTVWRWGAVSWGAPLRKLHMSSSWLSGGGETSRMSHDGTDRDVEGRVGMRGCVYVLLILKLYRTYATLQVWSSLLCYCSSLLCLFFSLYMRNKAHAHASHTCTHSRAQTPDDSSILI